VTAINPGSFRLSSYAQRPKGHAAGGCIYAAAFGERCVALGLCSNGAVQGFIMALLLVLRSLANVLSCCITSLEGDVLRSKQQRVHSELARMVPSRTSFG
jgi:hypothetical protein